MIYIVDLEDLPNRYTSQWKWHIPQLLRSYGLVTVIDGGDISSETTPGMFLNFAASNIYKAVQVQKIAELFNRQKVKDGDYFLFTDAWHPGIVSLKYMAELLNIKVKIGGLWHSGSHDPWDALGQIIGDAPWIRNLEHSFYYALDHNYFATEFHLRQFHDCFPENLYTYDLMTKKAILTGWPFEFMADELAKVNAGPKRDLILFPHRIAPEKQLAIFQDLAESMPQFEWMVCQEKQLTKPEYHQLLRESKMVFSASLQESFGIVQALEGPLAMSVPLSPNRLSYEEIFAEFPEFLYPSEWTTNWESYLGHKEELMNRIKGIMINYSGYVTIINNYNKNRLPDLVKFKPVI